MEKSYISKIVDAAIQEDLLDIGDITSSCVLNNEEVCFSINSREELMVCGLPIARHIFDKYIKKTECVFHKNDGDFIDSNVTLISGRARAADLFSTERVILNFSYITPFNL